MSAPVDYPLTTVVNVRDAEADIYIGRNGEGKWGNPFVLGRDGNRDDVIARFREWLPTQPQLMADLPELIGKTLGCHCHPRACHGDVLAELANDLAQKQHQELRGSSSSHIDTEVNMDTPSSNPSTAKVEPAEGAGNRVLISGSRDWPAARNGEISDRLALLPANSTVIVGDARGVDSYAAKAARELGHTVEVHVADWDKHGRRAGFIRNQQMIDRNPDRLIAFQVDKSRGTQHTITMAHGHEIPVEVYDETRSFSAQRGPQTTGARIGVFVSPLWPTGRSAEIARCVDQLPSNSSILVDPSGAGRAVALAAAARGLEVVPFTQEQPQVGPEGRQQRNHAILAENPDRNIVFAANDDKTTLDLIRSAEDAYLPLEVYDELTYVVDLSVTSDEPPAAELTSTPPPPEPPAPSPDDSAAATTDPAQPDAPVVETPAPAAANDQALYITAYGLALREVESQLETMSEQFSPENAAEAPARAALETLRRRVGIGADKAETRLAAAEASTGSGELSAEREAAAWDEALEHVHLATIDQRDAISGADAASSLDLPDAVLGAPRAAAEALDQFAATVHSARKQLRVPLTDRAALRELHSSMIAAELGGDEPPNIADLAAERGLSAETIAHLHADHPAALSSLAGDAAADLYLPTPLPDRRVQRSAAVAGQTASPATEKQLSFLSSLAEQLQIEIPEVATKAEAGEAIERLKALREPLVTEKQKQLLRERCEARGIEYVEPTSHTEYVTRLKATNAPTALQERALRQLSTQLGQSFTVPADTFAASAAIQELKSERSRLQGRIEVSPSELAAAREQAIDEIKEEYGIQVHDLDESGTPIRLERGGRKVTIDELSGVGPTKDELIADLQRMKFAQQSRREINADARLYEWETADLNGEALAVHEEELYRPESSSVPGWKQNADGIESDVRAPTDKHSYSLTALSLRTGEPNIHISTYSGAEARILELSELQDARFGGVPDFAPAEHQRAYLHDLLKELSPTGQAPTNREEGAAALDTLKSEMFTDPAARALTKELKSLKLPDLVERCSSLQPNEVAVLRGRYLMSLSVEGTAAALQIHPQEVELLEAVARHKVSDPLRQAQQLEVNTPGVALKAPGADVSPILPPAPNQLPPAAAAGL